METFFFPFTFHGQLDKGEKKKQETGLDTKHFRAVRAGLPLPGGPARSIERNGKKLDFLYARHV